MALADSLATRAQTLGETIMASLQAFYVNGFYTQNVATVWYLSTLAPACVLATIAKYTTDSTLAASYTAQIEVIVDNAITNNTTSSGLFIDGVTTFADTAAIEAIASIGWILYQMPGVFTGEAHWLSICQTNCAYLDTVNGNTTFYINGNYNVHLLNAYWLTAHASDATHKALYLDAYERALAFILNPAASSNIWTGYGFLIDTSGVPAVDWSDRLAHLTETNGYVGQNPSPNFDGFYSMLQLDLLARLYTVNRDPRIAQLMNSVSNKLEPKINTSTWAVDCTNGSRKNLTQGYYSAWYAVTSLLAAKAQNTTLLDSTHVLGMWDNSIIGSLSANSANGHMDAGTFRQLSLCIAVTRQAAALARGEVLQPICALSTSGGAPTLTTQGLVA